MFVSYSGKNKQNVTYTLNKVYHIISNIKGTPYLFVNFYNISDTKFLKKF